MAVSARAYTPAEAATLSDVAVKAVHNAIDKRIVQGRGGASHRRMLTSDDLLRLKLWYRVGAALSADRRQRLFDAVAAEPTAATVNADEFLIVDVAAARRQIESRVRQFDEAETLVESVPDIMGGEPVFKGTRVPVRTVATMLGQGANVQEITEGYPSLTLRMIELAPLWSAAHPARGRPKRQTPDPFRVTSSRRVSLMDRPKTSGSGSSA